MESLSLEFLAEHMFHAPETSRCDGRELVAFGGNHWSGGGDAEGGRCGEWSKEASEEVGHGHEEDGDTDEGD